MDCSPVFENRLRTERPEPYRQGVGMVCGGKRRVEFDSPRSAKTHGTERTRCESAAAIRTIQFRGAVFGPLEKGLAGSEGTYSLCFLNSETSRRVQGLQGRGKIYI